VRGSGAAAAKRSKISWMRRRSRARVAGHGRDHGRLGHIAKRRDADYGRRRHGRPYYMDAVITPHRSLSRRASSC